MLPRQHFNCWQLFVKATYTLCRREISLEELEQADQYIMEFLSEFEQLYGKDFCNIDLHLHAHVF